jgi:hypothetical protein
MEGTRAGPTSTALRPNPSVPHRARDHLTLGITGELGGPWRHPSVVATHSPTSPAEGHPWQSCLRCPRDSRGRGRLPLRGLSLTPAKRPVDAHHGCPRCHLSWRGWPGGGFSASRSLGASADLLDLWSIKDHRRKALVDTTPVRTICQCGAKTGGPLQDSNAWGQYGGKTPRQHRLSRLRWRYSRHSSNRNGLTMVAAGAFGDLPWLDAQWGTASQRRPPDRLAMSHSISAWHPRPYLPPFRGLACRCRAGASRRSAGRHAQDHGDQDYPYDVFPPPGYNVPAMTHACLLRCTQQPGRVSVAICL